MPAWLEVLVVVGVFWAGYWFGHRQGWYSGDLHGYGKATVFYDRELSKFYEARARRKPKLKQEATP